MGRLARLTQLFAEGQELLVNTPTGERQVFWIAKPNAFEMEQANHDGRISRARRMLAIREIGTPDHDLFEGGLSGASISSLITQLVRDHEQEDLLTAIRAIRSDPDWRDRVEMIEDSDAASISDQAELAILAKISTEYSGEVQARMDQAAAERRREYEALTEEQLHEQLSTRYIEDQGMTAFVDARRRTLLFFSLRDCDGIETDGVWDHANCSHERTLSSLEEVDQLPPALLEPALAAASNVLVAADVARFTDALPSSSDSSGSSSPAEESTASSPAETPAEPVTTSS